MTTVICNGYDAYHHGSVYCHCIIVAFSRFF